MQAIDGTRIDAMLVSHTVKYLVTETDFPHVQSLLFEI